MSLAGTSRPQGARPVRKGRRRRVGFWILSLLLMTMPGATGPGRAGEAKDRGTVPPLRATLYYTALQEDYAAGTEVAFRDAGGAVLRRGSAQFHEAAAIEGSARFGDGTVLNYAQRIDGDLRWLETTSAWGLDARGCELVPLRSVAVDPAVVALGTILLLEQTRGLILPDGSRHDGLWVAADTGEAILGDRIDLYTGLGMASMELVRGFGIGHLQALSVQAMGMASDCAWMDANP